MSAFSLIDSIHLYLDYEYHDIGFHNLNEVTLENMSPKMISVCQ